MSDLLAQLILARRSPDDEGWMNLLFVIVMAVIWIIGGVVKAMRTKARQEQQPRQVPLRKPPDGRGQRQQVSGRAERPAGSAQAVDQPSAVPKKRVTLADLRAAAQRFAAEAEQAFQGQTTTKSTPKPPALQPTPQVRPGTTPVIEPAVGSPKGFDYKQAARAAPVQVAPARRASDLLSDYTEPDKLKKAILHYEILGPPLSLRD